MRNIALLFVIQNNPQSQISPQALNAARQMSAKMNITLGQALIKSRALSPRDYVTLLNKARASAVECPNCNQRYAVDPTKNSILCHCGQVILTTLLESNNPAEAITQNINSGTLQGQQFGKYEILAEIARGGMGVVYKVKSPDSQDILALKLLLRVEDASETQLKRFIKEAKTAQKLDHPNIVKIWDYGEMRGIPYLVMDFIEGSTLREVLDDRGSLSLAEGLQILYQVGLAMEHAHSQNIIHRDLKIDNIILDRANQPWITDFGLAKDLASDTMLTQTGIQIGTPAYMAPEQAEGKSKYANAGTDIYAMGVLLYHILSGKLPFDGRTPAELFYNIIHAPPPDINEIRPDLPAGISTICQKAMAKAPKQRYPSALEMAEDLARIQRGEDLESTATVAREIEPVEEIETERVNWVQLLTSSPVMGVAVAGLGLVFLILLLYLIQLKPPENTKDSSKNGNKDKTEKPATEEERRKKALALLKSGQILRQQSRLAEALEVYEQIPEDQRNTPAILSFYGHCLVDKKQVPRAQVAFDNALALDSQFIEAHFGKVRCFLYLGQDDRAYRRLQFVYDRAPGHKGIQRLLAKLHFKKKNYTQAIALYDDLMRKESAPLYHLQRGNFPLSYRRLLAGRNGLPGHFKGETPTSPGATLAGPGVFETQSSGRS